MWLNGGAGRSGVTLVHLQLWRADLLARMALPIGSWSLGENQNFSSSLTARLSTQGLFKHRIPGFKSQLFYYQLYTLKHYLFF